MNKITIIQNKWKKRKDQVFEITHKIINKINHLFVDTFVQLYEEKKQAKFTGELRLKLIAKAERWKKRVSYK